MEIWLKTLCLWLKTLYLSTRWLETLCFTAFLATVEERKKYAFGEHVTGWAQDWKRGAIFGALVRGLLKIGNVKRFLEAWGGWAANHSPWTQMWMKIQIQKLQQRERIPQKLMYFPSFFCRCLLETLTLSRARSEGQLNGKHCKKIPRDEILISHQTWPLRNFWKTLTFDFLTQLQFWAI